MNNNTIFLLNPGFDLYDTSNCDLLFSVNENSFCYAIVGKDDAEVKALFDVQACENLDETIESCFTNDVYLSLPYNTVKAAFYSKEEMLAPASLADGNFENFTGNASNRKTYVNMHNDGFNAIFNLEDQIDKHFTRAKKYHKIIPLLELAEQDGLSIDLTAHTAFVLYKKEGKVIFQNQYKIEGPDEFKYYLLLIINTLNIAPSETAVWLTGIINEDDAMHAFLLEHFKKVGFTGPKGIASGNSILENLPHHYFSVLLALNLCA